MFKAYFVIMLSTTQQGSDLVFTFTTLPGTNH